MSGNVSKRNADKFVNVVEWISLVKSSETSLKLDRVRRFVFYGALVRFFKFIVIKIRPNLFVVKAGTYPHFMHWLLALHSNTRLA